MFPVSDPDAKHWLADDENFIATLGDLDRGLAGGKARADETPAADDQEPASTTPPLAATSPETVADRRAARVITAARALNTPPDVVENAPTRHAPARHPDGNRSPLLAKFPRPPESDPHTPRRLLNLFPESALEPEQPLAVRSDSGPPVPPQERGDSREQVTGELLAAIRARSGVALLIAPSGWGKTTLCRALPRELDRRTVVSIVTNPPQSPDDLLRTILVDFGVMAPEDLTRAANVARPVLTGALDAFLHSLEQLHAGALLVIDDAHEVPVDVLVELGATLAPGRPGARVLQLVLAGERALKARLEHPDLRGFDAGIAHRFEIGEPVVSERATVADAPPVVPAADTPPPDEQEAMHPRSPSADAMHVVDLLRDPLAQPKPEPGSLESRVAKPAAILGLAPVDAEAEPSSDITDERPGAANTWLVVAAFALLALAGAGGALWVWRDAVSRTVRQWEHVPAPPTAPPLPVPASITPVAPPPPPVASTLPRSPAL